MLTATIVGLDEANAKFSAYPAELAAGLDKTGNQLAAALLDKVRLDKLSGGVLNSRTGALAASISADVAATSDGVTASVSSSGVRYAGIQEYGGKTAAHEIVPTKGQALAFLVGGELRFARRIMHPGSVIPERSYLRSSLDELGPEIEAQMSAAVFRAWSDT
jgi:phage gpG-like protein